MTNERNKVLFKKDPHTPPLENALEAANIVMPSGGKALNPALIGRMVYT